MVCVAGDADAVFVTVAKTVVSAGDEVVDADPPSTSTTE